MGKPRIVSEARRTPVTREPPMKRLVGPHEWLSSESRRTYDRTLSSGHPFEMYLSREAECAIRQQAESGAVERLEVMGLLLGEVRKWEEEQYSVVLGIGTTDLESTNAKVRFERDALPKLFADLDRASFDYVIVGWYHSHPGHTCFMSKIDLRTQRTIFDQPYHTALVIDTLNREIKAFKLSGDDYAESAFAMFDAPLQGGPAKRTRKLRTASSQSHPQMP
jgi:proteasome lid subunit RPN8/RPN11